MRNRPSIVVVALQEAGPLFRESSTTVSFIPNGPVMSDERASRSPRLHAG